MHTILKILIAFKLCCIICLNTNGIFFEFRNSFGQIVIFLNQIKLNLVQASTGLDLESIQIPVFYSNPSLTLIHERIVRTKS